MKLSSIVKFLFFRVINMRRPSVYIGVMFCFIIATSPLLSQDGSFKPSRTEAETAWNTGDYETAYRHYNALLLLYSRDPSYKYYTGACLVKLERDPSRAVSLLGSAINSSSNVKTVPDDVWFHYGHALQMNGKCGEAKEAFDKFIRYAGKRKAQEYEVQKLIDNCKAIPAVSVLPDNSGNASSQRTYRADADYQKVNDPGIRAEEAAKDATRKNEPAQNAVLQVNNQELIVPEDYDKKLTSALRLQYEADSMTRVANAIRRTATTVPPEKRQTLVLKAASLEKKAAVRVRAADSLLLTLEPDYQPDRFEPGGDAKDLEGFNESDEPVTDNKAVRDSEPNNEMPVFSVFEIRSAPAYNEKNPIPVGKEFSKGLVYRIQLAAFKNPVPASHFKGLYPIYGKVKQENGVTYYYAGEFRTVESAREALQKVRSGGFPDAFVTAMMDDEQVSMERALILEKEWSKKPFLYKKISPSSQEIEPVADTVPVGTLYFRAEVMRSKKTVQPDVTEKIQVLSGRRGLDIIKNKQGETLFLVGNFITFESAEEYVSLLVRNGYPSAKVVAYVGIREIPVDEARKLLNKLTDD